MKHKIKAFLLAAALILCLPPHQTFAKTPYEGYVYNPNQQTPASLNGYVYVDSIDGYKLPSGPFDTPEDLFVADDDTIYIADSGNGRVLRMDKDNNVLLTIGEEDGPGLLDTPKGVFVTKSGDIYVADTGHRRIALYDAKGNFVRDYEKPDSPMLGDKFIFSPSKVAVDKRGYLFVVSEGASQGLLQITPDGRFAGFFGANHIKWSFSKLFVKLVATKEQKQQLASEKPPEFSNLFEDVDGFYYATTVGIRTNQIKRLSTVGVDILNGAWEIRYGDYQLPTFNYTPAFESFVDVSVSENGIITALDSVTGKAFQYDEMKNMLFVFGGIGDQNGLFQSPSSIAETKDGMIYVADKGRNRIDRFMPTPFGKLVQQAAILHSDGRYMDAEPIWQQVLKANNNYMLAYNGIGRALLKAEHYSEAMSYFKLGKDKYGYSEALAQYRKEYMRSYFVEICLGLLLLLVAFKAIEVLLKKRKARKAEFATSRFSEYNTFKWAMRSIRHPIDFFYDFPADPNRLKLYHACIIILCVIAARVISLQITGFALQTLEPYRVSVLVEATWIIVPWLTWAVASWGVSTITDGEGKFVDILSSSTFVLVPYIPLSLGIAALSNMLTLSGSFDKTGIANVIAFSFTSFMFLWVLLQLLIHVKVIHDFEFAKTIGVIVLSVVGMFIVWFIGLLLFGLMNQFVTFVISLFKEYMFQQ